MIPDQTIARALERLDRLSASNMSGVHLFVDDEFKGELQKLLAALIRAVDEQCRWVAGHTCPDDPPLGLYQTYQTRERLIALCKEIAGETP